MRHCLTLVAAAIVAMVNGENVIQWLTEQDGGFNPRKLLAECQDVSQQCREDLMKPIFTRNTSRLALAYVRFSEKNSACWKKFVLEKCWDRSYDKMRQGKCDVGNSCMDGFSDLEETCATVDGSMCNGTYEFGIAGAVTKFTLPTCAPNNCHNPDDMKRISQCVDKGTCGVLPPVVVSACKVDFGCYEESKLALYISFGSMFGFIFVCMVSFSLAWSGFISCSRKKSVDRKTSPSDARKKLLNEDRTLGGAQAGLLDGLGLNVPLTIESRSGSATPVMDLFSAAPSGASKNLIVAGTPSLLNTQYIDRATTNPFSLGGSTSGGETSDEEDIDETASNSGDTNGLEAGGMNRPKFKLSTQFERHVIKGFMFRREELRAKGESGWGAGSTAASSLVWRSLFYKSKGNHILKGVSGYIKPGMCVACIGAPDSGATTLLKVLAGRNSGGSVSGEILLDGYPPSSKMKQILAYIPKEDLNLPTLTVRETLEFSLNLRSPTHLPEKLRQERIDVVLSLLGLSHVADTIVGDQLVRGISGGEKRRVSLGVELVVGRSLLLASQPTNGLDSSAAYDVIKATRALSDTGLAAFMATISQPSPELLALFDTVCMISRGTCIYFGPTEEAERFFIQQGFTRPPSKAISDFLEEITGDAEQFRLGRGGESAGQRSRSPNSQENRVQRRESVARQSLVSAFRKSKHYKELGLAIWDELDAAALNREKTEEMNELLELTGDLEDGKEGGLARRFIPKAMLDDDGQPMCCGQSSYNTGFFYQLYYCLVRQINLVLRSPTIRVRIFRAVFQGTLIGSMFFQVDNDQQGATSRFGLVFLSISSVVFGSMSLIPELFAQRQVYYCQQAAGYFRPIVYIVALMICEIPIIVLETLINSMMVYSLCGLRNGPLSWNYIYFWMMVSTLQFTSWTMCFLIVMASPSAVVAQAVCPTFIALFTLFCGYLVPQNQLFKPMRWLWDVSPISRALKGLALNEVMGLSYYCKDDQLLPPLNTPNLTVPAPYGYNGPAYRTCPLSSGSASLYMYDYNTGEQDKWVLYLQNLVFPAIFALLLLIVMHTVHYETDSSDSAGQLIEARKNELRRKQKERMSLNQTDSYDYERLEEQQDHQTNVSFGAVQGLGSIEFHNLNYSVDIPRGRFKDPFRKQLLHNVSGFAEPGKIVALMGPSGAGKSTLLDVLADKKTGGHIQAELLLINGRPRGPDYPRIAGYVEQMDSHLPTQTVKEAVEASALLRLPANLTSENRASVVRKVLQQLNLGPFQDNLIGAPASAAGISGVSPEIRKKTTIAVELAMDPSVLFLDEPTTGLDAASALAVMLAVQSACAQKATMCTIHQPSAEVFSLFDWILLLQTGGYVCYFGPVADMPGYFSRNGFGQMIPGANPADFALECTRKTINELSAASIYETAPEKEAVLALAPRFKASGEAQYSDLPPYAASFGTQFRQLLQTQFLFLKRDTALLKMRCSTAIIFGLIIGVLFFDSKLDVAGAQARIGLCFISVTYVGYSAMLCIPQMVDQRPVVFRERTSNMYQLVPYFLAITVAEIPFILLQNFCFILTFYFMVGLRTELDKFLLFCFGMFMLNLACFAFSSWVAAIAPNADAGTIINTVLNSVFTLFCGFLLPYKSIPIYWKPLYYASMFRYPLAFLISNELHGRQFSCPNNERAIPIFVGGTDVDAPPFPFGRNTHYNPACALDLIFHNSTKLLNDLRCFRYYCPVEDGDALLSQYNFPIDQAGIWSSLSMLIGFYFLWRGMALMSLKYIQHIRR